jgi:hypothetical protein
MPHVRTSIRNAVVAALQAANTAAGSRVYPHRLDPLPHTKLPALSVSTHNEDVDIDVMGAPAQVMARKLRLQIAAVNTSADACDDLIAQVEQCIAANQGAGGCRYIRPIAVRGDESGDQHQPLHESQMSFEALYYTSQANPGTAL